MINERSHVITLDGTDYRLAGTSMSDMYVVGNDREGDKKMDLIWDMLSDETPGIPRMIKVR